MKMIEVKDYCDDNALIDPLTIQAVVQGEKEGKKITKIYFNGGWHINLNEDYEDVKRKLNEVMNYF